MNERQYKLPFGELIDKITISQLRETLLNTESYAEEIKQLEHDIDAVIHESGIILNARTTRIIFLIAQLNTLIWTFKDSMGDGSDNDKYVKYLKLSHQVNGLKNALKNRLIAMENGTVRTNIKTDNLKYHISI